MPACGPRGCRRRPVNGSGQFQTSVNAVAVDGGASLPQGTLQPTEIQVELSPATTMAQGLLSFEYNTQFQKQPAAPVGGTLTGTGGAFTAQGLSAQIGTGLAASLDGNIPASGSPGIFSTSPLDLAFGWTGKNNGTLPGNVTPVNPVYDSGSQKFTQLGLVSEYTNKINPLQTAKITVTNAVTNQVVGSALSATADLDGQWQTNTTAHFADGLYAVTMQEYHAATAFSPVSAPLYVVVSATPGVSGTAAFISQYIDIYGAATPGTITISNDLALTLAAQQVTLDQRALAVMQNAVAPATAWSADVIDSAANVSAALTNLAASPYLSHIGQISFTDQGTPTVTVAQSDYATDISVFAKMTSARYIDITNVTGAAYTGYELQYDPRNFLTDTTFSYTGISGQPYNAYDITVDYRGHQTAVEYFVSNPAPNALGSWEFLYEGTAYAGMSLEIPTVTAQQWVSIGYEYDVNGVVTHIAGAWAPGLILNNGYPSTFEHDFAGGSYVGSKAFYDNVSGQAFTAYEVDVDSSGRLDGLKYTGFTGQPFSAYELDYTGGTYTGNKVHYAATGQSYSAYEVDTNAAGQLTKLVYTYTDPATPYASLEYDYGHLE